MRVYKLDDCGITMHVMAWTPETIWEDQRVIDYFSLPRDSDEGEVTATPISGEEEIQIDFQSGRKIKHTADVDHTDTKEG
jgi:hypothetical protein